MAADARLDTAKRGRTARFGGIIDPRAYYTVYADRSERRYDAQSLCKLYLRIERPKFHALFGDFDTAIAEPQLTRYVRALDGVKAQYQSAQVAAIAFAADTPFTHRHDVALGARWTLSATLDLGVAASVRQGLAAGPRACPVGRWSDGRRSKTPFSRSGTMCRVTATATLPRRATPAAVPI